jgi:hypothetical protein
MSATAPGSLSFRRIVDIPFHTCVAALDRWQRTGHDGGLRLGQSQLPGPAERDRDSGTRRLEVRLARGPVRPALRMRLDIDRWSSSSTALELIPCGPIRPTAAYFRAGHLLLDSLTRSLPQHLPAAQAPDTASQAHVPAGSGRRLSAGAAVEADMARPHRIRISAAGRASPRSHDRKRRDGSAPPLRQLRRLRLLSTF